MQTENEPDLKLLNEAYDMYERKQYSDAIDRFHSLLARGSVFAALYLGYMYHRGLGVVADLSKAREFYFKAAQAGSSEGQYYVAALHHQNNELNEAFYWYTKAAEQSHVSAMYWIYSMYTHGEIAPVDKTKAQKYLVEAAKLGHLYAQRARASQLLHGAEGLRGFFTGLVMTIRLLPCAFKIAYRDPGSPLIH